MTHKISKLVPGSAIRVVMAALLLTGFGAGAALAQTRAYVANFVTNDVSVIDAVTHAVVATVPVGSGPTGVAVTPDGSFIYVTNGNDNNVSVISAATNTVVATVPVGTFPTGIAITPTGAFAYVTPPLTDQGPQPGASRRATRRTVVSRCQATTPF